METRGIAPLIAAVVMVAAMGTATAVPVAASVANVDPDHPLYSLKRVGERIRGLGATEQMKLRWAEYQRMVEKGKELQYREILQEFVDKLNSVAPYDVTTKQEIVRWMQQQMPGIGEVQLKLAELAAGENEELRAQIENLRAYWWEKRDPELLRAGLNHFRERLRWREGLEKYLKVDNLLEQAQNRFCVQENLEARRELWENRLLDRFEELQGEFEDLRMEVEGMLEVAPENLPGRVAAQRLLELALKEENLAQYFHDQRIYGRGVGLMTSAVMHLRNAERILEHAREWEPEHAQLWQEWRETWEDLRTEIRELWENAELNWEQFRERIRERWGG